MFDYASDGGLGFQLSMYRLLDDFDEARRMGREDVLSARAEQLRLAYNRMLAYAQGLERDLEQRNQQLATTQQELAKVKAELDYQTFSGPF